MLTLGQSESAILAFGTKKQPQSVQIHLSLGWRSIRATE